MIELEKKVSFQEHTIDELNKVIIDQQKRIGRLEDEMKSLRGQFSASNTVKNIEDEEPPPHY